MDIFDFISLAVVFAIGLSLGRYIFPVHSNIEDQLSSTQKELDSLKQKLKTHLTETALLFNEFDSQYKKLLNQFGDMSTDLDKSIQKTTDKNEKSNLNKLNFSTTHNDFDQPKDYED